MKKKIVIASSIILSAGLIAGVGFTLAAYSRKTIVDQNVAVANRIGKIIYLYAGEWDKDDALFKMFVCNNSNPSGNTRKYIAPSGKTIEGCYIFNFPAESTFDQITFLRVNPSAASSYFVDNADAFVLGVGWNKSEDYVKNASGSWSATNDMFTITGMGTARFIGSDSNDLGTISVGNWSQYGS